MLTYCVFTPCRRNCRVFSGCRGNCFIIVMNNFTNGVNFTFNIYNFNRSIFTWFNRCNSIYKCIVINDNFTFRKCIDKLIVCFCTFILSWYHINVNRVLGLFLNRLLLGLFGSVFGHGSDWYQ